MKSREYFKFVAEKIENDIKVYPNSGEFLKCVYLLGVLKTSDNLLRDIHTISRLKNFRNLGNYLVFILKKTEAGEVKFDNLIENLNLDKEFIINELLKCFNLNVSEEAEKEEPKEEQVKEDKISTEIKRILAESKFKVEEIDNELVAEEFIESDTKDDGEYIVRGNYLELLQPDNVLEDASVFSLPTDKNEFEKDENVPVEANDVFSLPDVKKEELEEVHTENVNTDELEEIKLDKNDMSEEPEEPAAVEITETQEEIIAEQESKESSEKEIAKEKKEEAVEEIKNNEPVEEEVVATSEEVVEEETVEDVVEIQEAENSVYMKYETELLTSNVLLRNNLTELGDLNPEDENYSDRKNVLIKEIVDSSIYMEEYSKKMSFEVITGIYGIMNKTFSAYGKTVGSEIIALFKNSINLIESLIKGEDFAGYDSVIKSLDVLKQALLDIRREDRKEEIIIEEKEEPEELPVSKEFDTNDRQRLATLKQNILDVENVFKSIEEIKGKYQAYEALRRLSHTFAHFKELVSIANILEMRKLSQLAEASYIFVKFIQNYRMDPFENEIAEVFKYIIYNFKLIFLDKPTKDIDLLISYLNDPVKIFEKKEKQ